MFHSARRMISLVDDEEGYVLPFQRFETRSDVFKGIENYRLVLSRANPGTFFTPTHKNVDSLAVVVNGRASITLIHQSNKETYNVVVGDIIRIRAGTIVHCVNPDDDLQLFNMLELTVSTPDYFESFFVAGSNNHHSYFNFTSVNRESFYNAFSNEVLQAAFNTDKDEARKLIEGRNDYVFVKVSQEQIKALLLSDQNSSESGNQHLSTPYNIFNQDPSYSNIYGKLHEIN
ncbi:cupin domain-containing protein, partial [Ralstonia pseudosolanacearum]|uniref:cupin domain-containing protein n=1 Tax=Ralstonia pseudosolanacearum TaxID=1310165 RepID=UPI003CEA369B